MASPYSPRLRTAIVLCGAGTAGAYQAGVLRALVEAGVKVDVLAGHGAGVITALAGAIDGGAKLWDATAGPWTSPRLGRAYRWRAALRAAGAGLILAGAALVAPLLVVILATLMYAAGLFASLVNLPNISAWLLDVYRRAIDVLFHPPILPTVLPRAVVLAVLVVVGVLVAAAFRAARHDRSRRRFRGGFWWRLVGAPLDAREPGALFGETLWALVRGASSQSHAAPADVGRRYVDLLLENLGQPGFREIVIGVHDCDSRRDLVAAVLSETAKPAFSSRRTGGGAREAEIIDLTGPQRELVADLLSGALRLPVVSAPHDVEFPADSYWRGERHRLCDRPELPARLVDEVAALGVEQVVLVTAAAPPALPHSLRTRPADLRARMGEILRSVETAAIEDARAIAATRFSGTFVIRPDHNPIGPFDFRGAYDEASDRRSTLADLMKQGYEDAYRQFIEPVVAAGDKVEPI